VEQTHRSALAHYDHRAPQMGQWVMIIAGWYNLGFPIMLPQATATIQAASAFI
jgi:hypothetical protein